MKGTARIRSTVSTDSPQAGSGRGRSNADWIGGELMTQRMEEVPQVLQLVMNAVADEIALCVPGNHDVKINK
jgi:hypothetical protein